MDPASGTIFWTFIAWSVGLAGASKPEPSRNDRGYSLEYEAPGNCSDAAALARAIEARTPGAQREPVDRAAVQLRLEVRDDGTSTLWIQLPEASSRRELPQADCSDTVRTVALIASMVLEAEVRVRSETAQTLLERAEPTAAMLEAAPAPAPQQEKPRAASPARSASASPVAVPPRAPRPLATGSRVRVAVAAEGLLESAVAKGAAVGASAGVAGWLEPARPGYWVPRVQAELLGTLPVLVAAEQGAVELRLTAVRLHLCPLRFVVGSKLQLIPCLTGDAGSLRAQGTGDTLNPKTRHMPWRSIGGTARAQLALGQLVSLESWLSLRGLAGGADRFVFNPDVLAYQVPTWSLGAGLGVVVTLP